MNRTYELMFIVRPDMAEEDQDKLISTLESSVTSSGGTVKNVERMGKRRLAYMVRRFADGMYILFTLEGFTIEEIARLSDRPHDDIRQSIHHARERIQKTLPEQNDLRQSLLQRSRVA